MIRFEDVHFQIGDTRILDGVSFEVTPGETLVLLGRSGSGKTTALKMVNAMRAPTAGRVVVDGRASIDWDPVKLRRSIGYVIQDVGLFPHRSVAENVGTVPRLLGWDAGRVRARVDALLEEVSLAPGEYRHRYPESLSGGQRQRVGVARALAAEPRILLFDEPFGALDPITRREMQDLFVALRKKYRVTSLFVTHDVSEALLLGSQIGLLRGGRLQFQGTAEAFAKAEDSEARRFMESLPRIPGGAGGGRPGVEGAN
ncbi:MAG: ATP-binding cassette domain-containing protein [Bryobacterales bacterium]|nr:ATP-binding cassette domain-containing protein [Bryobacterales bacterium]